MRLPESVRARVRSNRWLGGAVALSLALFTLIYYLLLRSRDLDPALINDQILLFALRNINALLVLAILFVLIRNLFKLWVERHNRILGSKFKTKLVATYIGLTLIPVLLLFTYATRILQGSLDSAFQIPTEELLRPGYDVAQALTSTIEEYSRRDAEQILETIEDGDLQQVEERPELDRRLQRDLRQFEADLIAIYEDTEFVHAVVSPQGALTDLPEIDRSFLLEALREGRAVTIDELPTRGVNLILGAAARVSEDGSPASLVVVGRVLEAGITAQTAALVAAYQTGRQLDIQRPEIRTIYLLLFLMVTLLILLISSWMGLYLARRVTVPIQALADGTRQIMSGDLDHRVEAAADDELGVLVDSFNRMTGELQRNRQLIEERNQDLVASNQQLDEERQLVSAVLENVAAGILSTDAEYRVLTCNGAALQMLQLREPEVLGQKLHEALHHHDHSPLLEIVDATMRREGRSRREIRLALRGEWKTFEVTTTTMLDERSDVSGHVIVLEDLTELIKAQKLATWNEAARRIAHEIKNPLTPIKLSAERLLLKHRRGDPDLGGAVEEAAKIIANEVNSMKGMVDEFARFARMPPTQPGRFDLEQLIEETARLYRDLKPGVDIESSVEGDLSEASLDAEQVRGALVNLLDNAVEATDAPGRVEISATRDNGRVRIRVSDTGPGIPADDKEKLFLPYYSTKGRGTGLGLAIVHRIVTDHNGTIHVGDNSPRGTVFTIELPQ